MFDTVAGMVRLLAVYRLDLNSVLRRYAAINRVLKRDWIVGGLR